MASTKDLKKRITTVKNTQQTTKAMKMVSAAKLRRAQEAITNHRPYARRVSDLIKLVSLLEGSGEESPLIRRGSDGAEGQKKKLLVMVVTSDRGLCGGFNSASIKAAQRFLKSSAGSYEVVKLGFLGRKAYEFFRTKKVEMGPYFPELGGKVTFAKAKKLAHALVELYLSGEVDEIRFIYNEFKNAVTQENRNESFLPLQPSGAGAPTGAEATAEAGMYIVKPSQPEILGSLLEKNFAIQTFRIMLESQAGEHGARMSAMENATKNAGEMIKKLTLQYNKQRQAGITKELLEIISGSESQKG